MEHSFKWWLVVGTGLVLLILAVSYMATGGKPLSQKVK